MPRVPVLDGPSVQARGLPAPRVPGLPPEAFGSDAGRALMQVGGQLGQIAQQEAERQNEALVLGAERQLQDWDQRRMFQDPDAAMRRRGRDAVGVADQILGEYDQTVAKVGEGLTTARQKEVFARLAQQRRASYQRSLASHELEQMRAFGVEQSRAVLEGAVSEAARWYTDPAKIAAEVVKSQAAIESLARSSGMSREAADRMLAQQTSAIHVAVLERMTADGRGAGAKAYLEANRDAILGEQAAKVEAFVRKATVDEDAFAQASAIWASGGTDGDKRAKAREIADADVRRATLEEIDVRIREREQQETEARETAFLALAQEVERRGSTRGLNASQWALLTPAERSSLEARAQQVRNGEEPKQNWQTWTDIMRMTPAQIAALNPMKYRAELDDQHFDRLLAIHADVRSGGGRRGGGSGEADGILTDAQRVSNAAAKAGIVPADKSPSQWNAAQSARYNAFEQAVDQRVRAASAAKGAKLSDEEKQSVIDGVLLEQVTLPGGFFSRDRQMPAAVLTEDERGRATIPYDTVPVDVRTEIERYGTSLGKTLSKRQVEQIAATMVTMRDATAAERQAAVRAIVEGGR